LHLDTPRLRLIPFAPADVLALRDDVAGFQARTGLRVAEGLGDFYNSPDVSPQWLERLRSASATDVGQHGFLVVHRELALAIGSAGFKGSPDADGLVEIAYGIVPTHQGRGYATEAAAALVSFAVADGRVRRVIAHTLPEHNASTRVLAKCGFEFKGDVVDPEDGPVWRWEHVGRADG
jgi:[ribosomal protein S5]-alanine N-acetyltransferase